MSIANPTGLQLGDVGTLVGKRYRVAGRVVLSALYEGERCYWNEFNLIDDAGNSATLVHEDEGDASPWKLFTYLEPQPALSAADAASKRVGDVVNFSGDAARITLVGESRVEFIEGDAPEGVEINDVAHYFNAAVGGQMIVVSWSGSDVEIFRGMDLPTHAIRQAFGTNATGSRFIPLSAQSSTDRGFEDTGAQWRWIVPVFVAMGFIGFVLAQIPSCGSSSRRAAQSIQKPATPFSPLAIGQTGILAGGTWTIRGHAVVEIAQVGARFDCHEYRLEGDDKTSARLVLGHSGKPDDWLFLTPIDADDYITPAVAASMRAGQVVKLHDTQVTVDRLFQTKTISSDLNSTAAQEPSFNLTARDGTSVLLLSWNAQGVSLHRGTPYKDKQVMETFKSATASTPR